MIERRRKYVVTALRLDGETTQDCDVRVCRLLGLDPGNTKITVTVYEPASDSFTKLKAPT